MFSKTAKGASKTKVPFFLTEEEKQRHLASAEESIRMAKEYHKLEESRKEEEKPFQFVDPW